MTNCMSCFTNATRCFIDECIIPPYQKIQCYPSKGALITSLASDAILFIGGIYSAIKVTGYVKKTLALSVTVLAAASMVSQYLNFLAKCPGIKND